MEDWNLGIWESWNLGILEDWKIGRLEDWNLDKSKNGILKYGQNIKCNQNQWNVNNFTKKPQCQITRYSVKVISTVLSISFDLDWLACFAPITIYSDSLAVELKGCVKYLANLLYRAFFTQINGFTYTIVNVRLPGSLHAHMIERVNQVTLVKIWLDRKARLGYQRCSSCRSQSQQAPMKTCLLLVLLSGIPH